MICLKRYKLTSEKLPFLLIFLAYLALFIFVPIVGDDAVLIEQYRHLTVQDHIDLIVYDYFNWSSRLLVNFVIHFLLGKHKLIFVFLNALISIIFAKSLSKLFMKSQAFLLNSFIVCMILIYPIGHLGSAGWLVTMMTYFWPVAMGFVALLPIRKIYDGEPFKKWEYLAYSSALIYSANEELELLVLLAVYLTFGVYFFKTGRLTRYYWLQNGLLLISFIFTLTAPGNSSRGNSEVINWFKSYHMLDLIDKLDIGFFYTMQNLIFENYLFMMVICFIMAAVVLKKYQDPILRAVALAPFVLTLIFGPLRPLVSSFYVHVIRLADPLGQNGLVTLSSPMSISFLKYLLIMGFAFAFMATIFLALNDTYDRLFAYSLLISGTASRVAMGLSPTIYASGFRTATPLFYGLIAIGIMTYAAALDEDLLTKRERDVFISLMAIFAAIAFMNSGLLISS